MTTRLATDDVPRAVELATLWRTAAGAPTHVGPPVWVHGDLHPFNLLVEPTPLGDRRLSAVVDFGDLTAGDPAVDLATRWLTLDDAGGRTFASLVDADPATWTRARGWAVSIASALAVTDDDAFRTVAARAIDAVLDG